MKSGHTGVVADSPWMEGSMSVVRGGGIGAVFLRWGTWCQRLGCEVGVADRETGAVVGPGSGAERLNTEVHGVRCHLWSVRGVGSIHTGVVADSPWREDSVGVS